MRNAGTDAKIVAQIQARERAKLGEKAGESHLELEPRTTAILKEHGFTGCGRRLILCETVEKRPSVAKAAVDFKQVTARQKPRPFKTISSVF